MWHYLAAALLLVCGIVCGFLGLIAAGDPEGRGGVIGLSFAAAAIVALWASVVVCFW